MQQSEKRVVPVIENITALTITLWRLAINTIWYKQPLSKEIKQQTCSIIRSHLLNAPDAYKAYVLASRIILTIQDIKPALINPKLSPADWFKHGLCGKGELMPGSKIIIINKRGCTLRTSCLPEALLDITEAASDDAYDYWIYWFSIHGSGTEIDVLISFFLNLDTLKIKK